MRSKIVIADDSPVIRHFLRLFIQWTTDWQICGEVLGGHPKPANEGHLKTGQRE